MVVLTRPLTVEAFDAYALLPENQERLLEYIAGEVVEVVSNPLSSKIAARLSTYIGVYLLQNDIGHMTGADGGYRVSGERYIPDVGFIRYEKQPELSFTDGYITNPPDLAVEVVSPGNRDDLMAIKVANYLAAGTVVWLVYPQDQQIAVCVPGEPVKRLGLNDLLDGGGVLPGFSLSLKDLFTFRQQNP